MKINFKKLSEIAVSPKFAYKADAGFDLCTVEDFVLLPQEHKLVPTGIALEIPEGHVGLVWDKSGIANNRHIKTVGGVIDSGYRGEIKVGLFNLGKNPQEFKAGDKIAQMLIQKVEQSEFIEVSELIESERGEKGFGSSGK